MPTSLEWTDIALRLALTVVAGVLIGFNRSEHGRPAGLRNTLLVCLAASVAMIQANLLLGTAGRQADAFVTMDVMRLPLGILSGIGFIGAGAIIRRDDRVLGVTTAATLWFTTVIGLCFGGGQIGLGLAALGLCLVVLSALKWAEQRMPQDRRALLVVAAGPGGPTEEDIRTCLTDEGFRLAAYAMTYVPGEGRCSFHCDVRWRGRQADMRPPRFLAALAQRPGMVQLDWRPQGTTLGPVPRRSPED